MPKPGHFSAISAVVGASIAIAAMAGAATAVCWGGFAARNRPGAFETALAHFVLKASTTAAERNLRNPLRATGANLAEAREHYADHCANCHANDGSGQTMYGDGLNPPPPDLRLPETQSKTDGELYSIIQNGVRMSGMPAFGAPGDHDESTWKLVLLIRHLPVLTPQEELEMKQANPISPSELKERQDEDDFLNGTPSQTTETQHKKGDSQ